MAFLQKFQGKIFFLSKNLATAKSQWLSSFPKPLYSRQIILLALLSFLEANASHRPFLSVLFFQDFLCQTSQDSRRNIFHMLCIRISLLAQTKCREHEF